MDTTLGITESDDVTALDDEALLASLRRLLAKERALSARLLVHLGEVDARGLYREHAFASMFEYCVRALHLSEAEAYLRIRAARLGRQFPRVLRMMAVLLDPDAESPDVTQRPASRGRAGPLASRPRARSSAGRRVREKARQDRRGFPARGSARLPRSRCRRHL
jgi:hypothetical protein